MCKHEKHVGLKLISLRLTSQNFPCKHTLISIPFLISYPEQLYVMESFKGIFISICYTICDQIPSLKLAVNGRILWIVEQQYPLTGKPSKKIRNYKCVKSILVVKLFSNFFLYLCYVEHGYTHCMIKRKI